jgi:myo-inositol-1(or 4)-monophosphatase
VDLAHAHRVAVAAAEEAGELLRGRVARAGDPGDLGVRAKGGNGDVVTELDVAADALILARLRAAFPGHRVWAEESGCSDGADTDWTWVVDPLDGTNNLAIGLTAYAVGIGLCERGVPRVAVIHDIVAARTWSAVHGGGATGPGGRPLRTAARTDRGLTVDWIQGHEVAADDPTAAAVKVALSAGTRRVLGLWAPLLSWSMLARGDIDAVIGYRSGMTELHTGTLLAAEAGVEIRDWDGAPFDNRLATPTTTRDFIAAPAAHIPRILELLQRAANIEKDLAPLWG